MKNFLIHLILFSLIVVAFSCEKKYTTENRPDDYGIDIRTTQDNLGNLLVENMMGEELVLYRVETPLRIIHNSPEGFKVFVPTEGAVVLDLRLFKKQDVKSNFTNPDQTKILKRWLVALSAQAGIGYQKTWQVKSGNTSSGELLLSYATGTQYQVDVFLGNSTGAKLATLESGQSYSFGLDYGTYNLYYEYFYSNPSSGSRISIGVINKETVNGDVVDIMFVLNDNYKKNEKQIPHYDDQFQKSMLKVFNKNSTPVTIYAGSDLIERIAFNAGQGTSTIPVASSTSYSLKTDSYVFLAKDNGVTIDQLSGIQMIEGYPLIWNVNKNNTYSEMEVINNTDYKLTIHDFEENFLGFVADGHQSARFKINSTVLKLKAKTLSKDATVILNSIVSPWVINEVYVLPTLQTNGIAGITTTTVLFSGSVSAEGSSPIKRRGFCYGTGAMPTVGGPLIEEGTGIGLFSKTVTGLLPSTGYYVRAFAENGVGVAYGNEISFTTQALTLSVITTNNVSAIATTSATSGGNVSSDGGSTIFAKGVCWSNNQTPTTSNSTTTDGSGIGSFTSSITSLLPNTTYYLRAYASNSVGTAYGNEVSFTTLAITAPTVTTSSVYGVTQTGAMGGGDVSFNGNASVTARGVCWSTVPNPVATGSHTTDGSSIGAFTSIITALSPSTTYYLRAYATNSVGTSYGIETSFITLAITLPTVTTASISGVSQTTAACGGNVTSDGGAGVTTRGVCWSTLQNPTLSDSHSTNGTGTGSFASSISGLNPSTNYYVRAYATNSAGTSYGGQQSFTTSNPIFVPTLSTAAVSNILTTSALSGGNITSDGGASVTARGICWSSNINPTVSNSTVNNGSGTGSFSGNLTGLTPSTTYYVRAFATNSVGTAYGNQVSFTTMAPLAIGQSYGGGIIFYLDGTGEHGLVAATSDQGPGPWGCYGSNISGADGTAIGTGMQNTIDIVTGCGESGSAAVLCNNLVLGGYSDWYLPSKDELNQLYLKKGLIGGFSTGGYLSSSETSSFFAWGQSFSNGSQNSSYYKSGMGGLTGVRAIRSF